MNATPYRFALAAALLSLAAASYAADPSFTPQTENERLLLQMLQQQQQQIRKLEAQVEKPSRPKAAAAPVAAGTAEAMPTYSRCASTRSGRTPASRA